MNLGKHELDKIVDSILPHFEEYVGQYDERKYPPAELRRLRIIFAHPPSVTLQDVEAALVWKYGHSGKPNYPKRHRQLVHRIWGLWPTNAIRRDEDPVRALQRWCNLLGQTSFITVCFLLHLAFPGALPILDQHNFRSVNYYLAMVGCEPRRQRPRRFEDLLLVRDFSNAVLGHWPDTKAESAPSPDDLDRYLMMHGKSLKSRDELRNCEAGGDD